MRAMKTVKSNVRSSLCQRKGSEKASMWKDVKTVWGRAPSRACRAKSKGPAERARRMAAQRECRERFQKGRSGVKLDSAWPLRNLQLPLDTAVKRISIEVS